MIAVSHATSAAVPESADVSASALSEARPAGSASHGLRPAPPICQDFPAKLRGDTGRLLRHYGDLLHHPAIARPGLLAPVIRFCRKALHTLLRPWLELQSRCNAGLIDALERLHFAAYVRFAELNLQMEERCQMLQNLVSPKSIPSPSQPKYHGLVEPPIDGCTDEELNRELGPAGRLAKAGLWFNPPVVVGFAKGRPRLLGMSERILEPMFIHTRLPKPPATVLDLGCAESIHPLEMASFGYEVTGVDLRDLPVEHPSFRMVRADIADLPFADACFDVVVSLSTLEHVGLDWYGTQQKGTDFHVVAEVHRVLRPGGLFLLTVPYGRPAVTPLQRVYDRTRLDPLLHAFERQETLFGVCDGTTWSVTSDASRAEGVDSTERTQAVALLVAKKS